MIKQILVSSCVLFSATFVVQAQNPKLGVSPIQDVINAMTLDEKIQLVVGSTGKYESQMEATIGNQGQFCLLYTSPSPRDRTRSRMPSSA